MPPQGQYDALRGGGLQGLLSQYGGLRGQVGGRGPAPDPGMRPVDASGGAGLPGAGGGGGGTPGFRLGQGRGASKRFNSQMAQQPASDPGARGQQGADLLGQFGGGPGRLPDVGGLGAVETGLGTGGRITGDPRPGSGLGPVGTGLGESRRSGGNLFGPYGPAAGTAVAGLGAGGGLGGSGAAGWPGPGVGGETVGTAGSITGDPPPGGSTAGPGRRPSGAQFGGGGTSTQLDEARRPGGPGRLPDVSGGFGGASSGLGASVGGLQGLLSRYTTAQARGR